MYSLKIHIFIYSISGITLLYKTSKLAHLFYTAIKVQTATELQL